MASRYSGPIATLAKATLTGVSRFSCANTGIPRGALYDKAQFAVLVTGITQTMGINVVGSIGGATRVIAGDTGIAATGSVYLPLHLIDGVDPVTGVTVSQHVGVPRPKYVSLESAEDASGIDAVVYMAAKD
jgi:hypothetical protein